MFSSAVPVQSVPSIWQAFHDGMACVTERISAMTPELRSSACPTDDPPPALVCSRVCAEPPLSPLALFGGEGRLKEPEVSSKAPPDEIQSCQDKSWGMASVTG